MLALLVTMEGILMAILSSGMRSTSAHSHLRAQPPTHRRRAPYIRITVVATGRETRDLR